METFSPFLFLPLLTVVRAGNCVARIWRIDGEKTKTETEFNSFRGLVDL